MKFWEALREMERGAVCMTYDRVHRLRGGTLECFNNHSAKWTQHSGPVGHLFRLGLNDWYIHKPAPNDAEITWQQAFEMMMRGETVQVTAPAWRPFSCRIVKGVLETDQIWSWRASDCNNDYWISDCRWRKAPVPAPETFDFAEAWKRRNDKWITRPGRTGLRLSRKGEMLGFWKDERDDDGNQFTQLFACLATNDLDATDWHEVESGQDG